MPKMEIKYEEFCEILGYKFTRVVLFKKALTHSSFTKTKLDNNERLEFLGDRVLGLSVAKMLYQTYPLEEEGALAVRHANLVSARTLASIAEAIAETVLIEFSENFFIRCAIVCPCNGDSERAETGFGFIVHG